MYVIIFIDHLRLWLIKWHPMWLFYSNICWQLEGFVIDKPWCQYEPDQKSDYAVHPGLIKGKTPVNNGCYKMMGAVAAANSGPCFFSKGCLQFQ